MRYSITGTVQGGIWLKTIEAPNARAALETLTSDEATVSFCHQCGDQCEDPQVVDIIATNVNDPDDWSPE